MKDYLLLIGLVLLSGACSSPVPSPQLSTGYAETVQGVIFVMKAIPGGEFMMGCGIEDEPCADEEWINKPQGIRQHPVIIEPFYLAETETTWSLYQQCIDTSNCTNNDADGGDNGWGKGNRPVVEVSWNEITKEFIPWLNSITGRSYRLPTESEWEYAARAGTTTKYSWGNDIDCTKARYGYVSEECGKQQSTDSVKSFQPNDFGLYDMHGNVWEYVQDCWNAGYDAGLNWSRTCEESVLRGGSWLNKPDFLRSAARFRHDRTYRESGDGFRLAHNMN